MDMSDTNITKKNRKEMIDFLEKIKSNYNDDETLKMVNKIENTLTEKKFWISFEEHREEVDELLQTNIPVLCEDANRRICKDKNLPRNFIIEWDNLQALYLLLKTHKWKINVIYIDPPYNTGTHDWKYNNDYVDSNDGYRHSKWLSMMKVRLDLAKQLLNPEDSVLICTIDEKEYLHLGCLLEEMFPEARIQMVSSVINTGGSIRTGEFSRTDEYIFFVKIGDSQVLPLPLGIWWRGWKQTSEGPVLWRSMLRGGEASARADRPNMFFPVLISEKDGSILGIGDSLSLKEKKDNFQSPEGCIAVWPIRKDGSEGRWRIGVETARNIMKKWYIKSNKLSNRYTISYLAAGVVDAIENGSIEVAGKGKDIEFNIVDEHKIIPWTAWQLPSHDASKNWTAMLKSILCDRTFPFPKSLYAVHDAIRFFVDNKPNAIILDFFAGSWTTQHAVGLLNAEDWGSRSCIIVTNNEIWEQEEFRLTDLWYKKWDEEREKLWIAKYITRPRMECVINWIDIKWKPLEGNYWVEIDDYVIDEETQVVSKSTWKPLQIKPYKKIKVQLYPSLSQIKKADWLKMNLKYFKCDWTPRKPEDYFLSNVLLLHIKEMIELENAVEIDNVKNVAILNKDDYKKYILDDKIYDKIENIWVNQKIIFNSDEFSKIRAKNFRYIPTEYFWQELKDNAE